jgi:WD40 repeat protein
MVVAGPETVRIWRPGRRQQIAALGRVACGDDGGRVILWEVRARTRTAQFDHDGGVHAIAFSPDGRTLASAAGSSVTLWDVRSRTRTRTLTGHAALVGSVAYSPDGRSLATAGHDRTIRLWTTATS